MYIKKKGTRMAIRTLQNNNLDHCLSYQVRQQGIGSQHICPATKTHSTPAMKMPDSGPLLSALQISLRGIFYLGK